MTGDDRRDDARSGIGSDYWSGVGTGWAISSTLLGGMLAVGGLGYLVDRLVGTTHVFTGIGFVIGGAGGVYAVYLRYGRGEDGDSGS
jgi:F0F1-type ATP synthase assembly protein I